MSTSAGKDAPPSQFQEDSELLQSLLGISDLLVVAFDTESRIQLFNRACEELTGFSADQVIGRSIWSTLIPEDELPDVHLVAERLQSGQVQNKFTNHWLTRDGGKRLIQWRNTTLHNADGSIRYILGTGIDVTAREHALEAHRQSQNRHRELLDALPALAAELDRDYRVRFANRGYEEWFGLDPEAQLGKHVREVIGEDGFQTLRPSFDQALSGERAVYHGEVPYARGGTRFIHGTYLPAYDRQGRVDGLYILAVDITEKRQLQSQLAREYKRSQTIIDNAIDGIVTIDAEGLVHSFNPAAERIFGYAASEVIGRNVSMLMREPDWSQHDEYIKHYLESGEARVIGIGREVTGLHRDGTPIPLQLAVAEFFDEGLFFVGFLRDISQRKRAEREAREHFAELAHVTRLGAMGEVTSGLAHEISQPLTAISAMAEAGHMMTENPDTDPAKLRHTLVQISKQGQRARDIIEQLRGFLRKDQPEATASLEPGRLIENVLTLLTHEIEVAEVAVQRDIEPAAYCCLGNRVQIEQVLFNLIKNAVDAMREIEGERILTLKCRRRESDGLCEFNVMDTGPGIPEQYMDRLFHPFFTTKSEGLGQGLSICKSIVQRHGGELEYDRQAENKGAVFRFTLPIDQPQQDD